VSRFALWSRCAILTCPGPGTWAPTAQAYTTASEDARQELVVLLSRIPEPSTQQRRLSKVLAGVSKLTFEGLEAIAYM
jgi:hypothetical protein